jgi:hypothetical protein
MLMMPSNLRDAAFGELPIFCFIAITRLSLVTLCFKIWRQTYLMLLATLGFAFLQKKFDQ